MKLKDLLSAIERTQKCHKHDWEDLDVMVNLPAEVWVGARAAVDIKTAGRGIDWENNRFELYPEKSIGFKEKKSRREEGKVYCVMYAGPSDGGASTVESIHESELGAKLYIKKRKLDKEMKYGSDSFWIEEQTLHF